MKLTRILLVCFVLLGVMLPGCAGKNTAGPDNPLDAGLISSEKIDPVISPPQSDEPRRYLIGPEDVLGIRVYRREDLSAQTPVRDDGNIFVPLAGTVRAEGLTVGELSLELTQRLSVYLKDPQVDVVVVEYHARTFSLLGELQQPGTYPLSADTKLLEAIGQGGGFSPESNLTGAYLIREGTVQPIDFYALFREGDVRYNVYLEDQDFIYIPSRKQMRVYVLGEVNHPQVVEMTEGPLTLAEAIARAGGFNEITAFKSHVKIIRGGLTDPEMISVDFDRILRGKEFPLVELKSGDIVFVPASGLTKWDRIMGQLLPNLSRIIVDAAAIQSLTR